MIVVADTSPLNYLILIEQIELLEILYSRVLIPHAVLDETLSPAAPPAVRIWARNPPAWLELLSPSKLVVIPELDPGETEAILLAEELRADWLLIDDLAGRKEAERRGLRLVGTLGILVEGHRRGVLDLPTAIRQLLNEGFRASPKLIHEIIANL
jgi:predicted nucleic acid-binding protein